jgi:hypothetical protein
MWRCYELTYKAKSDLHIGYGSQLGMVTRTRYYIPGKTMWGAVTAVLSRIALGSYNEKIYERVKEFVKEHLIFSYFYPTKDGDILYPNYTEKGLKFGNMNKEEFEKEFISSYVSTALDKTSRTAEEGSLHEFELISPAEFVGYLFTNLEKNYANAMVPFFVKEVGEEEISVQLKGKDVELFDAIREIQVGGERIYGFGRLELLKDKQTREVNKILAKYELNLTADRPRMKSDIALSHVMVKEDEGNYFDKLRNIRGDIEPLVGREWSNKGAGQDPKFEGVALVPGSRFELNEMEIGPYGILRPV